jgi:cellulose synthase/poly-beta-1,6-N-acetylglucosamine synthase-like glycosyltransferase
VGRDAGVSAVVCTWNRAREVCAAVESILAQSRPPEQVIVVDDGSSDGTRDALARFGSAIEVIHQPNQGASAARNTGIRAARGAWVAFLDSDDRWLDFHLSDLLAIAAADPTLVWAFCTRLVEMAPGAAPVPEVPPGRLDAVVDERGIAEDYLRVSAQGASCPTSGLVIRRELLLQLGGFDVALRAGEDLDLWWKIARDHPRIGVGVRPSIVMTRYREDSLSASARGDATGRSDLAFAETLRRHLRSMREAGRGAAFDAVAAPHLEAVVQRALLRRDLAVLRRVGWRSGRLLTAKTRAMHRFCLATGGAGAALLARVRGVAAEAP